jgi:hypothetical protein
MCCLIRFLYPLCHPSFFLTLSLFTSMPNGSTCLSNAATPNNPGKGEMCLKKKKIGSSRNCPMDHNTLAVKMLSRRWMLECGCVNDGE